MKTNKLLGRPRAAWLASLLSLSLAACQKPTPVAKSYPYLLKIRVAGCQGGVGKLLGPEYGVAPLDTAKQVQGQFVFRGTVAHPGVYNVYCSCENKVTANLDVYLPADSVDAAVTPGTNQRPDIYQPAGLGQFGIGSYHLNTQLFSTAPQQREAARYLLTRDSLWNKYFLDRNRMKARIDAAIGAGHKPEIDRWADSTRQVHESFPDYMARASAQFINQHPHSAAVLFALREAGEAPAALQRLRPYYRALPDSVRNSYFGQLLQKRFQTPATGAAQPPR